MGLILFEDKLCLFNSLTRKKEEFIPINPQSIGMYTCGPTVYQFASIGNLRTYVTSDILRRTLAMNGYKVKSVMNITDVGHLVGDGDMGEDKLAKSAEKEHKTAWDIARFYEKAFLEDSKKLGIMPPDIMPRATEHIQEQIQLIKVLEKKRLTYKTSDGIYFNTLKYEETGKKYGELSTLDEIREGARVEVNPEKQNPRDFALWKFSTKPGERHMEWESPWGVGFPGWHIECSAMSMKYLGQTFDIHVGGEDLRQTHHPNEVAQSEGATGKKFVNYWVHTTFLLVDGKRMGKSEGNMYTVSDVEKKGFSPRALRYLYLTAHYRDPLNFSWESLEAAQSAFERLRTTVDGLRQENERTALSSEKQEKIDEFRTKFVDALDDDLNTPQAIAVLWDMLKSNIPSQDKYDLALYYDEVLGLGLAQFPISKFQIPNEVKKLVEEREGARKAGDFKRADELRDAVLKMGYSIEDTESGAKIKKLRLPTPFAHRASRGCGSLTSLMQEFFWKHDTGIKVVFFLAIVFIFAYVFFTKQKIESVISRLEEKVTSGSVQPSETTNICGEDCQNLLDEKIAEALATLSAQLSEAKRVKFPVATTPSPSVPTTTYLPLGSGGSTKATGWTVLDGSDFIFDLKDYPEGTKVHWNGNLKADVSNSRCFARIYDNSNFRGVDFSEQATSEKTFQNLTSQPLMIWAGRNTYRVEIKSLNGITCSLGSPRLIFKY